MILSEGNRDVPAGVAKGNTATPLGVDERWEKDEIGASGSNVHVRPEPRNHLEPIPGTIGIDIYSFLSSSSLLCTSRIQVSSKTLAAMLFPCSKNGDIRLNCPQPPAIIEEAKWI
ncbi:hypothetical protein NMY22_g1397 [Coprinellus aureogranulatus]|nr:hypothetical protein NMY22_g1397 [Coprinellus aureogranulatus]